MNLASTLPLLLALAWLLPLVSFVLIVFFGPRMGKHGILAAWVATGAIVGSCILSTAAFTIWVAHPPADAAAAKQLLEKHSTTTIEHEAAHEETHPIVPPRYFAGDWYTLGQFGSLKITIGYYIDSLTVVMFAMVTLIASLIHFYTYGYMHDELHDVTDHEVTLANGRHLHRQGRFHRFYQFLSLFCFSMLGLVIAGNIAMVFVFWELVGICSYFLIGFYIERKRASTAANKAFIVNRVGDFGMIIGLMALWGSLGTFAFGDQPDANGQVQLGIFSQVRQPEQNYALKTPDGMVKADAHDEVAKIVLATPPARTEAEQAALQTKIDANVATWRSNPEHKYGYWLLVVAGLGIFCGCVGKSAQFPLHTWLPDAMEGPTPVSALVHSATMVAAGVYLVGRFYPVFAPEVLYTIAWIGGITLLMAATIAITATDIKRVLAYSTISQLGYMMFALGVGGWVAGLFHLITHAFFKSLLFMCSGSVIHACHTNEMPRMGGLRKKMPITAYTMLVGCLAISGAGIPFVIGFSGYYSKDTIIAQALSFHLANHAMLGPLVLLIIASGGAALTSFYMFRLWYLTFAGHPRDHHVYEHAHESPRVMFVPLLVLAFFATAVGWTLPGEFGVQSLLEQSRPAGTQLSVAGGEFMTELNYPNEFVSHEHEIHRGATFTAFGAALLGFLVATLFYGWRKVDADEVRRYFGPIYRLFLNKWYFDEIYNVLFVQPVLFVARRVSDFDRRVIDWLVDHSALAVRGISTIDNFIDRWFVDGLVNATARLVYSAAVGLRTVQTGRLRQYVMFIVIGTVGLFVLISFFMKASLAGP